MKWTIPDIDILDERAAEILNYFSGKKIFALYGEMGAGKTSLIKSFIKQLGAEDRGQSPTFSIVNTYKTDNSPIYHFDMYRLRSEEEVYDIGFEEYLSDLNAYVFIEWPEKIPNLLPVDCVELRLKVKVEARIIEEL